MAVIQKVVLLGASGVLGSAILHNLQADADFEVTVLSRHDSHSQFVEDVKVFRTNYSRHELQQVFEGQDAVICTTGLSAIAQQRTVVDACIAAGVSRYVTNDFGNPDDFQGLPELEFARTPKREIREYVEEQASSHESFTWTALATGHFLDYAIKKFPAAFGFNVPERSARLVDGGAELFSSTTLDDIGAAVIGILKHPDETANKSLLVRTLETSQNAILKAFEQQTASKWNVTHTPSAELYERGKKRMNEGERGAMLDLLPVQIFQRGIGRSTFPRDKYDNDLLGVKEQSVDDVVRAVLSSY